MPHDDEFDDDYRRRVGQELDNVYDEEIDEDPNNYDESIANDVEEPVTDRPQLSKGAYQLTTNEGSYSNYNKASEMQKQIDTQKMAYNPNGLQFNQGAVQGNGSLVERRIRPQSAKTGSVN